MQNLVFFQAIVFGIGLTLSIPVRAQIVFTEITDEAGVAFPGILTESLAWGDFDNDGDQDLYLTNDGRNKLMENDGTGIFTDVTPTVGGGNAGFGVGTAWGDFDNDGFVDLYLVNFQRDSDVLCRNNGPGEDGSFTMSNITDMTGIDDESSSRGVALLDYDQDGLLDIYVNAIGDDILYHNLGNMQFENVAAEVGIVGVGGQGVGVVATDINNDGWIDIFTGNRTFDPNRLFLNNGDGSFTDITVSAGIDKVGFGMGVHAFDYDNDLDMDLYWTCWPDQPNALYENVNGVTFVDVAAKTGTLDATGWGISNNAGDVNNDGWEDFFITNGFDPSSTANILFRNNGDKTFTDITMAIGGADYDGRGASFADIDNDGDLDLCVTGGIYQGTNTYYPTRLWRNDTVNNNRWIKLELVGTVSNRSAIGARVEIRTDLTTMVKEVSGGAGRGSFNSLPLEFGLGEATEIQEIRIRWPNQGTTTLTDVALDQFFQIVEVDVGTEGEGEGEGEEEGEGEGEGEEEGEGEGESEGRDEGDGEGEGQGEGEGIQDGEGEGMEEGAGSAEGDGEGEAEGESEGGGEGFGEGEPPTPSVCAAPAEIPPTGGFSADIFLVLFSSIVLARRGRHRAKNDSRQI